MGTKLEFLLFAAAIAILSIFFSLVSIHLFHLPLPSRAHRKFRNSEVLELGGAVGPESLAFDSDGRGPYTGVSDGRILKWQGKELGWAEFAVTSPHWHDECLRSHDPNSEHECGRPLGLQFDANTGNLYIADAYFGLLMVGPGGGQATQLVTHVEDVPLSFTNGIDIDTRNGVIYFSDSSLRYQRREFMSAVISGDKTGRVIKYDLKSKRTTTLLDNLSFPNGIALSEDGSFLLIAETNHCRVLRFWLQTCRAGTVEVFSQLPGFPDNIKKTSEGDFWVAIHSRRGKILERILSYCWVRNGLVKLFPYVEKHYSSLSMGRSYYALALKFSKDGDILMVLEDEGSKVGFISQVEENNGSLWIGSVVMPFVGLYKLI